MAQKGIRFPEDDGIRGAHLPRIRLPLSPYNSTVQSRIQKGAFCHQSNT